MTQEVIRRCLKGSREAHFRLFELYYSDGMNVALRYSSCREDAQEILSDAFTRAFKKLGHFDDGRPFLPWFTRIIVHCSSDYYRYAKPQNVSLEVWSDPVFDDQIIESLSYEDLLALVQKLSPILRSVFNLYVVEGYKHQEIAEMLQIAEGTSKAHLSRARVKMKKWILELQNRNQIEVFRQEDKRQIKGLS